jgi:hypothetical protein
MEQWEVAMTTHATIGKGLRILVASFFATCLLAAWPLSAQAGKNGGGHVQTQDLHVTKTVDQASPRKTGTSTGKGQQYIKYDMKNVYISQ